MAFGTDVQTYRVGDAVVLSMDRYVANYLYWLLTHVLSGSTPIPESLELAREIKELLVKELG